MKTIWILCKFLSTLTVKWIKLQTSGWFCRYTIPRYTLHRLCFACNFSCIETYIESHLYTEIESFSFTQRKQQKLEMVRDKVMRFTASVCALQFQLNIWVRSNNHISNFYAFFNRYLIHLKILWFNYRLCSKCTPNFHVNDTTTVMWFVFYCCLFRAIDDPKINQM